MSIIRNANELNHYFNQFLSKSDVTLLVQWQNYLQKFLLNVLV